MLKSKLRNKILKIRQVSNIKNIKIDFSKILDLVKKEKLNNKNIGGYYPVNFEVDTLNFLNELDKKGYKICLPVIKKKKKMKLKVLL